MNTKKQIIYELWFVSWVLINSAINYEKRTEKTQNKTKQMLRSKYFWVEILFEGDAFEILPEYADYPK